MCISEHLGFLSIGCAYAEERPCTVCADGVGLGKFVMFLVCFIDC